MKNSCPQWDSNPGPSAYEANSLSLALLVEISIEHLNVDRVLPECAIKIYMYCVACVRCNKMFCHVLHFINSLQSANVLISQTLKQQNNTNGPGLIPLWARIFNFVVIGLGSSHVEQAHDKNT